MRRASSIVLRHLRYLKMERSHKHLELVAKEDVAHHSFVVVEEIFMATQRSRACWPSPIGTSKDVAGETI